MFDSRSIEELSDNFFELQQQFLDRLEENARKWLEMAVDVYNNRVKPNSA